MIKCILRWIIPFSRICGLEPPKCVSAPNKLKFHSSHQKKYWAHRYYLSNHRKKNNPHRKKHIITFTIYTVGLVLPKRYIFLSTDRFHSKSFTHPLRLVQTKINTQKKIFTGRMLASCKIKHKLFCRLGIKLILICV